MASIEKQLRQAAQRYVKKHSIKSLSDKSGVGYQSVYGFVKDDKGLLLSAADALSRVLELELRKVGE